MNVAQRMEKREEKEPPAMLAGGCKNYFALVVSPATAAESVFTTVESAVLADSVFSAFLPQETAATIVAANKNIAILLFIIDFG
jgi:hypothetical protein